MHSWPSKDPNEVLDYQFDWTDRLETGETISTRQVIIAEGDVVLDSSFIAGPKVTAWLSGGTAGVTSVVTCRITTSMSRTYDESARLRIRER